MKKPINKFAVMMWAAAALVAIVNGAQVYEVLAGLNYSYARGGTVFLVTHSFLAAITGTIAPVALLTGFGALIEIMDKIRWQGAPRE